MLASLLLAAPAVVPQALTYPDVVDPSGFSRLGSTSLVFSGLSTSPPRDLLGVEESALQTTVLDDQSPWVTLGGFDGVVWRDRMVALDSVRGPVLVGDDGVQVPAWPAGPLPLVGRQQLVATPGHLFVLTADYFSSGLLQLTMTSDAGAPTEQVDIPLPSSSPLGSFGLSRPLVFGDRIFFITDGAADGLGGAGEAWISDGTAAGTFALDGVDVPVNVFGLYVEPITDGELVWFEARTGSAGREPWVTDGTQAGTRLLTDAQPGAADSRPEDFVLFGDRLAFRARVNGVDEVWSVPRLGGTAERVPGLPSPARPLAFRGHEGALGDLLFAEDNTPGAVNVLWASDGTAGGAMQLVSSSPLTNVDAPLVEVASDGTVLLRGANAANGTEIFRTRRDASLLALAVDVLPGGGSSNPQSFVAAGPRVYFRTFTSPESFNRLRSVSAADLGLSSIQSVGQACPTAARLSGTGDARVGGTVSFDLEGGAPAALGAVGFGTDLLPFGDGTPCGLRVVLRDVLGLVTLDGAGGGTLDVTIPALPSLAGVVVRLQHFEAQVGGPVLGSFAGSNVLELVIGG